MDLKHLFLTYSDNEYNSVNDSYYMMDSELLQAIPYDGRISNSLIFDTNRRTIYAKGMEFGGINPVFIKVEEGTGQTGTNIASKTAYYVTSVTQDKYGQIAYTYSYAYLNLDFGTGHKNNAHGGAYMTGMYVDNNGTITYEYAEVNHTTTPTNANTQQKRNNKGVLIDVNLDKQGNLTYDWYDATVTSGGLNQSYTVTNSKPLNVLTGITQSSYGQIAYTYTKLNTTHTSTGTQKTDIQDYVITYAWLDADGNFTYNWRNLETTNDDGMSGVRQVTDTPTITLQNAHSYRFITNINQCSDGKIVYTYADVNTTHSSTGTENNNHNLPSIVNMHLNADGILSYEHVDLSGNTGAKSNNTYLDLGRNEYNVIDGISQASDGKITYTYRTIKTTHNTSKEFIESEANGDEGTYLMTGVSINNDGDLSYTYTKLIINQSAQAGTLTYLEGNDVTNKNTYHTYGVTWMYKDGENSDKVTFAYTDLTTNSGIKTLNSQNSNNESTIMLYNTAYRFITNVSQAGDGKISYTYADFRTTHSTEVGKVFTAESLIESPSLPEDPKLYDTGGVITWVNLSPQGILSFSYKKLSAVGRRLHEYTIYNDFRNSPEFICDLIQHSDGSISYKTSKLNTRINHISDNVTGVVYEVNVDIDGQNISYAHKNLATTSGSDNGTKKLHNSSTYNFITSVSQNAYGKLSYEYMTLQTSFDNLATGDSDGVIANVHIDSTGKLSYAYVNLSGNTGTRTTGPSGDAGEHIPYVAGTYTYFITGISQDKHGKLTYTYAGIYSDAENNYKYHSLTIPQTSIPNTDDPSTDTVKVINGISTTNGNATSHTVSYETISVPTKKYVDELIKSNDALRYCGTVTPATSANGTFTLHHDTSGPGHTGHNNSTSIPDTDCGALYKVDGTGFFGEQRVSAGDIIISYKDSARADSAIYWNVINENIDLRTLAPDKEKNSSDGSNVVTNTWLTADGTLSYTTYALSVSNNPSNTTTSKTTQKSKSENILLNEANPKGFRVITDVNLSQTELDTKLTYTYTYLYVDQKHHSTNTAETTANNTFVSASYKPVLTGVSLSADGILSYSVTPFNITESEHAGTAIGLDSVVKVGANSGVLTNLYVNSSDNNKLTYVITDNTSSLEQSNGFIYKVVQDTYGKITATGRDFATAGHVQTTAQDYVITYTYIASDGKLHYTYRDLSGNTGTSNGSTTITNDTKLNVITGISQTKDGKISYTYNNLNTTHTSETTTNDLSKVITYAWLDANGNFTYHITDLSTSDPTSGGTTTLTNSTTQDVIISISQASNGKITATKKTINTTHTSETTTKDLSKVITYAWLDANGNFTYHITDLSTSDPSSGGTTTLTNSTTQDVITSISQASNGKITATKKTINTTHTNTGSNDAGTSKVIGAVNLDANGNFTYSYVDIAQATYHYGVTTNTPSTSTPDITININGTTTTDLVAYSGLTNDAKGHLTGSTKPTYKIKHGAANTSGSAISKKTLIVPYDGTTLSDDFVSYKSITTNNGHITSYVRTSYELQHGVVTTTTDTTTFVPSGTSTVASVEYTNGHITKVNSTTVTDLNVKFVKDTSNNIYISGTKTAAGNVITNAYTDGVAYIKNGTLYETNIQAGTSLSVGSNANIGTTLDVGTNLTVNGNATIKGNTTLGDGAADSITIKAKSFEWITPADNTNSSKMQFTHLEALWGTL